jgi:hypothetical protein
MEIYDKSRVVVIDRTIPQVLHALSEREAAPHTPTRPIFIVPEEMSLSNRVCNLYAWIGEFVLQ